MASKQPISQLIMCNKGVVRHVLAHSTQVHPKLYPNCSHTTALLLSKARSCHEYGYKQPENRQERFFRKYSLFFLVIRDFMLTFATDKHNSITNKRKVARKNERNDNDNGQMPSGSKTKVKQVCESTGGLYLVVRCVL